MARFREYSNPLVTPSLLWRNKTFRNYYGLYYLIIDSTIQFTFYLFILKFCVKALTVGFIKNGTRVIAIWNGYGCDTGKKYLIMQNFSPFQVISTSQTRFFLNHQKLFLYRVSNIKANFASINREIHYYELNLKIYLFTF